MSEWARNNDNSVSAATTAQPNEPDLQMVKNDEMAKAARTKRADTRSKKLYTAEKNGSLKTKKLATTAVEHTSDSSMFACLRPNALTAPMSLPAGLISPFLASIMRAFPARLGSWTRTTGISMKR